MKKYFDNIYCINLSHRKDRWSECLNEFKKIGIENTVERFDAYQLSPPIAGCTKSHYEVINLAKSRGEKNILILEDDFEFITDNVWNLFENSLNQLFSKNLDYDMFYFGGTLKKNTSSLIDKNLVHLFNIKTTHCYSIKDTAFDIVINRYKDLNWNDSGNWNSTDSRLNIDHFYTKEIQSKGKCYGIYPGLCQQRASYSDLLKQISGTALWNIENNYNNMIYNENF